MYGVLPWHPDVWLDSEDALDLAGRRAAADRGTLKVAVVRLPRISNFTDVDALGLEPGLDVVFAADPRALSDADLVVLPGTRATIADLAWLRERGLDRAVARARRGRPPGARRLRRLPDARPDGRRPARGRGRARHEVDGLGLLDVRTDFGAGEGAPPPARHGARAPAPAATRSTTAG